MALRTRLTIALVSLAAVGLLVSDVVTYRALRAFLYDRLDEQVNTLSLQVVRSLSGPGPFRGGYRTGVFVAPPGTWAGLIGPDGRLSAQSTGYDGESEPRPLWVPGHLDGRFHTVESSAGHGHYRLLAQPAADGQTVVVAISLRDVNQTLGRLIAIEVLATVAILAAVGLVARLLVRRGLRPLEDIGRTAGAIAAGDLSQRVDVEEAQTEVGRLARAFNTMLSRIETAFGAQQESEQRLRRFVADASHELRTPLTSIRGYAELFRRGAADRPEDLARVMRRIEQEAERMGVLVDDLLLLARLDQGRPLAREPVDLARLAADAVDDARAADPEREVTLDIRAIPTVSGDEARLRQVVSNLLTNARQHTPPGTPVRVTVGTDGEDALLEVADDGPGLTSEQAARVFERFYRADPARSRDHGGTGLGLAIVAAITEAHGGTAVVETSPGRGARFRVGLPLAAAETAGGGDGSSPAGSNSPAVPPETSPTSTPHSGQ